MGPYGISALSHRTGTYRERRPDYGASRIPSWPGPEYRGVGAEDVPEGCSGDRRGVPKRDSPLSAHGLTYTAAFSGGDLPFRTGEPCPCQPWIYRPAVPNDNGLQTKGAVLKPSQGSTIAVSTCGEWEMLLSRFYASCAECGGKVVKGQRMAWNRRTQEVRCTRCVGHLGFESTRYGRRRRKANQSRNSRAAA